MPPVPPPPPAWAKDAYSRGTFYLDRRDWNSALQAFDVNAIVIQDGSLDLADAFVRIAVFRPASRIDRTSCDP